MLAKFRRIVQVTLLTAALIFGAMLMIGSFDTDSLAQSHHTSETYIVIGSAHFGVETYTD